MTLSNVSHSSPFFVFFSREPLEFEMEEAKRGERENKSATLITPAINCTRFRIPTSVTQGQVRITVCLKVSLLSSL